jgi:hypothetical protein
VWATFNVLTKPDGTRPRNAPMVLRHTAITRVLHDDYKAVALIYQNNGMGEYEVYTFFPLRTENDIRRQRRGHRIATG